MMNPTQIKFTNSLRSSEKSPNKKRQSAPFQLEKSITIHNTFRGIKHFKAETFNIFRKPKPSLIVQNSCQLTYLSRKIEKKPLGKDIIVRFKPRLIRNSNQNLIISKESVTVKKSEKEILNFKLPIILPEETSQDDLFNSISKISSEFLNGFNVGLITYGESKSGKSFNLLGDSLTDNSNRGILPRFLENIFDFMQSQINYDAKYEFTFSSGKIYNNGIIDLLNQSNENRLSLQETMTGEVFVENITDTYIGNLDEILYYLKAIKENISKKEKENFSTFYSFELFQRYPGVDIKSKAKFFDLCELPEKNNLINLVNYMSTEIAKNKNILDNSPHKSSILTHLMKNLFLSDYKTFIIVSCEASTSDKTINSLKLAEMISKLDKIPGSTEFQEKLEKFLKNKKTTEKIKKNDQVEKNKGNVQNDDMFDDKRVLPSTRVQSSRDGVSSDKSILLLMSENERLKEELQELKERNSLANLIEIAGFEFAKSCDHMEKLTQNFKKTFSNAYNEENKKLKILVDRYEKEALEETKGIHFESGNDFANFNCFSRIRILACNLGNLVENLSKDESTFVGKSYVNLYNNTIFVVEEILREFTQNKDIFNTYNLTKGGEADQVLVDRKQYNFLKNSYSQLSILLIHYEKLLMELLNRLYIDLANYKLYENCVDKYETHILDINNSIKTLLNLFEKLRDLKLEESQKQAKQEESKNIISYYKTVTKNRITSREGDLKRINQLEQENFILREEINAKEKLVQNLIFEADEAKKTKTTLEKSILDLQESNKIVFEQELNNQVEAFNILREFFLEEINMAKNIINGFNDIIDDFIFNEKFYSLKENKHKFINCYTAKARSFIKNLEPNDKRKTSVIYKIHEKLVNEEGNASRKIELFLKNKSKLYLQKGLNGNVLTKCPLARILKHSLNGDKCDDVWTMEC